MPDYSQVEEGMQFSEDIDELLGEDPGADLMELSGGNVADAIITGYDWMEWDRGETSSDHVLKGSVDDYTSIEHSNKPPSGANEENALLLFEQNVAFGDGDTADSFKQGITDPNHGGDSCQFVDANMNDHAAIERSELDQFLNVHTAPQLKKNVTFSEEDWDMVDVHRPQ